MTDKPIIIDGVDVSGCSYAILPKSQCPQKAMLYAKEVSCIACKENNTKLNFCKNNHNCNYKQLQREKAEHQADHDRGQSEITRLCGELQRKTAELDKIEEVIAPYQEPLEADAFSLSGAIKSILQRKTAECEKWKSYYQLYRQNTDVIKKVHEVINSDLDYGIKFIEGGYIEKCEPLSSQELDKQVAYIINDIKNKLQIATEALEIIANQNFKYTSENICNLAQNEQIPCSNNCKYCFQQYAQHALEQIEGILNEK